MRLLATANRPELQPEPATFFTTWHRIAHSHLPSHDWYAYCGTVTTQGEHTTHDLVATTGGRTPEEVAELAAKLNFGDTYLVHVTYLRRTSPEKMTIVNVLSDNIWAAWTTADGIGKLLESSSMTSGPATTEEHRILRDDVWRALLLMDAVSHA